MCFSPQADLVGGIIIGAVGFDTIRHVHQRHGHIAIASLPLLLAAHQLDEAFVWWGLQGHVSRGLEHVTLWIYLVVAFVVLPIFVPLSILALEPTRKRKWMMMPFVAVGVVVGGVLLAALIRGPSSVALRPYHLAYSLKLSDGLLIVSLYVVAVCGALLFSGSRRIVIFGIVNLIAIAVIARLTIDGFASVWCGWAAISSGAIAIQLRVKEKHHPRNVALP